MLSCSEEIQEHTPLSEGEKLNHIKHDYFLINYLEYNVNILLHKLELYQSDLNRLRLAYYPVLKIFLN